VERSIARTCIEHLRAGVPSRPVAGVLSAGRTRLLSEIEEDLRALESGRTRRSMRIIAANYGDGKSHTLNAIRTLAERGHFLVSQLTVSRESPLDRVERIYRKLLARTYYPGLERPGIDALVEEIERRPEATQRLLRYAQAKLHPKVGLVLEARLEGRRGDIEPLERDLSGYFLATPELRRAYADNVGAGMPAIDRFKLDDAFDYLRLVGEMATVAGLAGWVILIDEVEMIGSVGRRARAKSYDFLLRLQDRALLPQTYSVAAVAASFQQTLAEQLREGDDLPLWLQARGEEQLAQRIREPIRQLQNAPHLPPLSEADLAQVFDGIVRTHGEAFDWSPPLGGQELLKRIRGPLRERDTKVRQLVRAAVHFLDLYSVYGEEPTLQVHGLEEPLAAAAQDDEPEDGAAVRRGWSG